MKRPKREPDVGGAQEEEEAAEEQAQLCRRLDENGLAVRELRSQIVSLQAHFETQAAAFRGMEQARVMGEQVVELKAEIRIKDAALAAKDAILQSAVEAKDIFLQANVQAIDAALQASAVAL